MILLEICHVCDPSLSAGLFINASQEIVLEKLTNGEAFAFVPSQAPIDEILESLGPLVLVDAVNVIVDDGADQSVSLFAAMRRLARC